MKLGNSLPAVLCTGLLAALPLRAQNGADPALPPVLLVEGEATVRAAPDQAVLRLGAVAQHAEAQAAQQQVNRAVTQALAKLEELGFARESLRTVDLSLYPIYSDQRADTGLHEPRIVGYRASNMLQVLLADVTRVGEVVDVCTAAGLDHVEGLTFGLADRSGPERAALRGAVREARSKAEAMAAALDHHIVAVKTVRAGGTGMPEPRYEMARAQVSSDTPVAAGDVEVRASVAIEYWLAPGAAEGEEPEGETEDGGR